MTAKLGVKDVGPLMAGLVTDAKQPASVRAEALFALEAVKAKELADATKAALGVAGAEAAGRRAGGQGQGRPDRRRDASCRRCSTTRRRPPIEKQMALGVMGELKESKEIDAALAEWLDRYSPGRCPPN